MTSLLLLQLLAFEPSDSYVDLAAPQLLEKRRVLVEERPGLVSPAATASVGLLPFGGGVTWLVLTAMTPGSCQFAMGSCVGAGALTLLGAAAVTFGVVWLIQRLGIRSAIGARIDEINDLIDLKRSATSAPAS
jgi:hypothetical protein